MRSRTPERLLHRPARVVLLVDERPSWGVLSSLSASAGFAQIEEAREGGLIMEGTAGPAGEVRAGQLDAVIADEDRQADGGLHGQRIREVSHVHHWGCGRVSARERSDQRRAERRRRGPRRCLRVARVMLQHAMEDRLVAVVERLTGRKVRRFPAARARPASPLSRWSYSSPATGADVGSAWQGSGTSPLRWLRERFPAVIGPPTDDICYATTNRQAAVRQLVRQCELVLVVGSRN
jgi:LytB protein